MSYGLTVKQIGDLNRMNSSAQNNTTVTHEKNTSITSLCEFCGTGLNKEDRRCPSCGGWLSKNNLVEKKPIIKNDKLENLKKNVLALENERMMFVSILKYRIECALEYQDTVDLLENNKKLLEYWKFELEACERNK